MGIGLPGVNLLASHSDREAATTDTAACLVVTVKELMETEKPG